VHFAESRRGEIRVASNGRTGGTSIGSAATARLRQREWYGADGHKQKQVECASDKMRFGGGINLLFHLMLSFVSNPDFAGGKITLWERDTLFGQKRQEMSRPFS
jgi:hypothetical protein